MCKVAPDMSEIPNDSTDSTFQIAWASLADLSYQKNWISTGEANRKRDKELEELEVRKYFFVVPHFRRKSSNDDSKVEKDMESRFAQTKYDVFRSAVMKSSAFMALLTAGVAVHATLAKLWVRTALLWGLIVPLYAGYSLVASRRGIWKRLAHYRVVLLFLLGLQSASVALAEWDRPLPTAGLLLLHTTFVNNFSPLGVVEIFFVTAIGGVLPYLILTLYPDWQINFGQPGHCNEEPGAPAALLQDIVLPPFVCICQFALAIWRDETMRLDFLLRDQLQAQRRKLKVENEKSEDLLKSMLPQAIIDSLKRHEPVECQDFQNVTVIFVQVCDFSVMCSVLPATTIVQLLDKVFQELDRLSDLLKVHKVETVGDVYMAVSGCPHEIANHADVAAHFAIAAQSSILRMRASDVILPQGVKGRRLSAVLGEKSLELRIRIGMNSGRIRAGVVGLDKPRFKLFGDTVNTASRMESTSEPGCTQISEATKAILGPEFNAEERGLVEVKGKGALRTYYLRSYNVMETDDSKVQESVTIKVVHQKGERTRSKELLENVPQSAPGNHLLRRAAGNALKELVSAVPAQEFQIRSKSTGTGHLFEHSSWKDWVDMKLLLVSSSSKRPDMLARIEADKVEYKRVTLDRRIFFSRTLIIGWHLMLAFTALLDFAFQIPYSDWEQYRLGVQARTWGVQVCGWVHLGLLMDKASFDHRGRLITVGMLALEGAAMAVLDALIFGNDTSFFMLYGLYVLFSKNCPMRARLTLCFLSLTEWAVVDTMLCDWRLQQRAFEHVSYTTVVLLLTAAGIRMQEHLDHCANYYERHVQRQIHDISDVKRGNQKLLSMILPSHVVQMVSDGISPIAEDYPNVSVVFTDLQGFTAFSSRISPMELVELLNLLYSAFDEIIMDWGVHKVEVIGDAYFISSGCPVEDTDAVFTADEYAMRAVEVALALQRVVPSVCDDNSVQMRCGIHTGNVIAGVVGKTGPRFHLFGPTVEYANRMESTGLPGKVQISDRTKQWLDRGGHDYIFEDRIVEIAGQEERTFLVTRSKARAARKIRTELAMHRHVSPHAYVMSAATEASEIV
ncbi:unnamed protein product [Durusdinium trenchii]|uniref:Uncharacterized protein n=2 Tax=Durusdinium trenchii TaxID=1381693 RepID=A0ABP0RBD8_9DINO